MDRRIHALSSAACLLLVVLLNVACSAAAAQGPEGPKWQEKDAEFLVGVAPESVRRALQAGEYGVALRELRRLEGVDARGADVWMYLQGVTLELSGDLEGALGTLERLEREHGESGWMHKSRFRRAEILRGMRRFEEAEAVYEEESMRLRSGERKAELAAIYLRFADERSAPEDASLPVPHTPDYREAIELYQAVLDLDAPREQRDHALYRIAECKRLVGDGRGAFAAYGAYVAAFDPTGTGEGGAEIMAGSHFLEARLHRADGAQALGNAGDARRGYQGLVKLHRRSLEDAKAWSLVDPASVGEGYAARFRILAGDAARKIAATWARRNPAQAAMGMAAIQRYVAEFPAHSGVPAASFDLAGWAAEIGRHAEAIDSFDEFLASEPHAEASEETVEEHARLSMQALFRKGALLHSQGRFEESIGVLEDYVRTYPNGPDWAAAQASIVNSEHRSAEVLRETGEYEAARASFLAFLATHPLEARAAAAYEVLGQLFAEEARELKEGNGDAGEVDALFAEALAQWRRVAAKYPGREESSLALYRIAHVLEVDLDRLEDGVAAYREVLHGSYHARARAKLLEMTVEAMGVRSPRVWRSDEDARVVAQLRNVKQVNVKVHRLDLEAYFLKHLTHQSISDLDLDLIPADHEFTYEVEDYEDYAGLEREVVLPVEGPGAWAVVVSAGEKRATVLVLRSDVDIVVKSSRREVFVWAEDMRKGEPAAGVKVLVGVPGPTGGGDGATLYNLQTSKDGTARLEFDGLREAGELRILAIRGGHFASNSLGLGGLSLAKGLSPRGLVYTDRSAYQRGELVSWRAIVRTVEDGAYAVPAGVEHAVEIMDSRGRVVSESRVACGKFGTLSGQYLLDSSAPQGVYSISCQAVNGAGHRGSFMVADYQLERLSLEVELDRDVYFRGERVEVGVRAAWYYGEALGGAPVQVHLPDGRVVELVTDAEGFASTMLETVEFPEERRLEFRAVLLEEGVSATRVAQLAVRGFALRASVARDVVLAGEQVGVSLSALAPDGAPLKEAVTAELQVLERVSERGRWTERLVETRVVEIVNGGEGREPELLSLGEGGSYVVRLTAEDRFGNPISAEDAFLVSGDEDEVSLRVLAEESQVDVGQQVVVQLVNRGEAALALLTLEGERVLEHHVIELEEGVQEFRFQVQSNQYPSVTLGLAVMRTGQFDVANAGFEVARALVVSVEVSRDEAAPGERVELTLVVRDQLGQPVEAELSVAVVDDAIFAFEPDATPKIHGVFSQGVRRLSELRTVSTCAFSFEGVGSTISAAILEEELRVDSMFRHAQSLERARGVFAGLEVLTATGAVDFEAEYEESARKRGPATLGLAFDAESFNDAIGIGGGGGGRSGGRFGGRRSLGRKGKAVDPRDGELMRESATAFWVAAVETDGAGRAVLSLDAPERSTRWRVVVRGVGVGHLFGEARASFQTRSAFFCELEVPRVMARGDRVRPILRVHNATGEAGEAEVTLRMRMGGEVLMEKVGLALGTGVTEHVFSLSAALEAGSVTFEVDCDAVIGGERREAGAREVADVRLPGVAVAASRAGVLTSAETIWLELPTGSRRDGRGLSVHLGGGQEQVLVDALLAPGGRVRDSVLGVPPATTASELIGICALVESMRAAGRRDEPRLRALMDAATRKIGGLVAMQRLDGGWPWVVGSGSSHSAPSARCVWALADARGLGMIVPRQVLDLGAGYLNGILRSASQEEDERKAMVLHALAEMGRVSFGPANRLHRVRANLSPAALAYTALALAAMDRAPMAADVSRTLAERYEPVAGGMRCGVGGNTAWSASSLEMTALALLAHEGAGMEGEANAELGEHLMAERPWFPVRARGMVVAALARRAVGSAVAGRVLDVRVALGDGPWETVRIGADGVGRELLFDVSADEGERVSVSLDAQGRGEVHYELVLRGVHPGTKRANHARFQVSSRKRYALAPRYLGRSVQTGFGVLSRESNTWSNHRSDVRRGEGIQERITFSRDWRRQDADRNVDWFVAEIPLPAGAEIMDSSLSSSGSYHHEVVDGRLLVYIGQARSGFEVSYTLLGAIPGEYHMAPVILRSVNDPGAMAYAELGSITVLDRGEASADTYKPTPDELFHLGKAMYESGESEGARARLSELYASNGTRLRAGPLKELAKMMLFLSITQDDSNEIVRFFEVLKERDPALVIPFDEVVRVAEAYRELEEYERALLIFRAIVEETFGKDLKVVGTLEAHGEFLGATEVMERLYAEFPDLPVVTSAFLALSDMFLKKAPEAISDPRLRAAGMDEVLLKMRGILLLRRFLATHSQDPLAPDAALNLVTAYLSLEDYERASALAGEMSALYTDPEYADSFGYSRAVSEWYLGNDSAAMELLETIATAEYTEADGSTHASQNRDLALYILAQIHHARQAVEDAVAYYGRVEEVFSDAKQALLGLRHQSISMEEVTHVAPGEQAELVLEYRNIERVELLVYEVDLMTLYLRERSLADIRGVKLAGIAPVLRKTVSLEVARLRPGSATIELDLDGAGAYLVMCRGAEQFISGLVLVSDLDLDVREDPLGGVVRVEAVSRSGGEYLRDVDVRVVGRGSEEFFAGETDLRGLYVAEGVVGVPTVIARLDGGHYAFHRGDAATWGLPVIQDHERPDEGQMQQYKAGRSIDYFQNISASNRLKQSDRGGQWRRESKKEQGGLQIQQVQ